ncbi:unnamed protein product [Brassicogethes aeneus]|uniref:Uncharacterized protein n=1 Tax=Brassicogethes aeneus TaxID=1431903 RepID=A0A9P0FNG4_BRAAE|nr:unnamed protein product [Brassicogethes aeneus]
MPNTRKDTECPVFGAPSMLKKNVLPTYADVIKSYLYIRQTLMGSAPNGAEPTLGNIADILIEELKVIWAKASVPVVTDQQILHMIKQYHEKLRNLKKPLKSRYNDTLRQKVIKFRDIAEKKLFDISSCKCVDFSLCKCKNKVPVREREFLVDQRTDRKMFIGSIDPLATKSIQRSLHRKDLEKRSLPSTSTSSVLEIELPLDFKKTTVTDNDCGFNAKQEASPQVEVRSLPSTSTSSVLEIELPLDCEKTTYNYCAFNAKQEASSQVEVSSKQMRIKLPSLAQACDRTGVSDRSAAIIASAVLKDIGLITSEEASKIIDRSKIRRERKRTRSTLRSQLKQDKVFSQAIYFDGRKDNTLVQRSIGNKNHRTTVSEEHIVIVSEPGSKYFGHITVPCGTAKAISENLIEFLQQQMDLTNLVAIGCDGTAVNTGIHNGVNRRLELYLGRPLQWFICMLHANELPLRHLMKHLDGETTGPSGFSGEIGKKLQSCELLPVTDFQRIPTELPEIDLKLLSTDQKYLYNISLSISSGDISEGLANTQPGKMAHSRWLTTANRVLRLYVATSDPSENLKYLTEYILKVYVPTWFSIKVCPEVKYGPRHLLNLIKRSRYMPCHLRDIVDKIIQINGYFAHPENILLAMLADSRIHFRELGLRRILKSRANVETEIRKFKIPEINFEATAYLINHLLKKNTFAYGSIRQNRKEYPNGCIKKDSEPRKTEYDFVQAGDISVAKWKDLRTKLRLLCTMH